MAILRQRAPKVCGARKRERLLKRSSGTVYSRIRLSSNKPVVRHSPLSTTPPFAPMSSMCKSSLHSTVSMSVHCSSSRARTHTVYGITHKHTRWLLVLFLPTLSVRLVYNTTDRCWINLAFWFSKLLRSCWKSAFDILLFFSVVLLTSTGNEALGGRGRRNWSTVLDMLWNWYQEERRGDHCSRCNFQEPGPFLLGPPWSS